MKVLSAASKEEVLELAVETGLSFYDASYLHVAMGAGLTLATEDAKLSKVAQQLSIHTATLDVLA